MNKRIGICLCFFFCVWFSHAQTGTIRGKVTDDKNISVPNATVMLKGHAKSILTDKEGAFEFTGLPYGEYKLSAFAAEKQTTRINVYLNQTLVTVTIELKNFQGVLNTVTVKDNLEKDFNSYRLNGVDGFSINESKKNEVIRIDQLNANLATNNARQIFARVPGLNIWESDRAGLQMGIGGRGLNPNRTSNFNTRQNGYDMSADALGYPESYYTPPAEAIDRIQILRGASSLQYGTQFGGMINFIIKSGSPDKKIEVISRQTTGSWNLFSSFNGIGGTVLKNKLTYYTFFQYKQGDGWRPNSAFNMTTIYGGTTYKLNEKFKVTANYTYMNYLAKQAGGLTDAQFSNDPGISVRSRNWFTVNWNLFALEFEYKFNDYTKINVRNFGLAASRKALGNLERINVVDLGGNRTMIDGTYNNLGNETRLIHHYHVLKSNHTLLAGFRIYKGSTEARQGDAGNGSGADFTFINPNNLENSDFRFPNTNYALFAENVFRFSTRFSVTPGIRYEFIHTKSDGYYRYLLKDLAGNIVVDQKINDNQSLKRDFVLAGIGASYKMNTTLEIYGNISQNYRAVNFSDLRIVNPNMKVDSSIHDEKGFTADIGIRGHHELLFNYDVSVFMLSYRDKIGQILKADQPPLYLDYRYRTNISDALTYGIEVFAEADLLKMIYPKTRTSLTLFVNSSFIDSRYVNSDDKSVQNKKVEFVPQVNIKCGNTLRHKNFHATWQVSYISEQFSDATNTIRSSSAVNGIIPAYFVADISFKYLYKRFSVESGLNNLLNTVYFTRRADSYPGPGIIPSDPRNFYITLGCKI